MIPLSTTKERKGEKMPEKKTLNDFEFYEMCGLGKATPEVVERCKTCIDIILKAVDYLHSEIYPTCIDPNDLVDDDPLWIDTYADICEKIKSDNEVLLSTVMFLRIYLEICDTEDKDNRDVYRKPCGLLALRSAWYEKYKSFIRAKYSEYFLSMISQMALLAVDAYKNCPSKFADFYN